MDMMVNISGRLDDEGRPVVGRQITLAQYYIAFVVVSPAHS
jgi:hypothetical protein